VNFSTWLEKQRDYQATTYKVDYANLAKDVDAKTDYVTMNLNAAFLELAEAQQETPWKPWATAENRVEKWEQNRGKFIGELVDVLFFISNALVAVGCTDEELATRYEQKMEINRQRQAVGYANDNKCRICGRAFDDHDVVKAGLNESDDICVGCFKGEKA